MITAREIEKVTFSKPPIGKRGYNEDEVDAFLDLVGADVAEYEQLVDKLQNQPAPAPVAAPFMPTAPPPPAAPEPPSAQAARILELAERTAAQLTEEAETNADFVTREANDKAGEIVAEARYEAKNILDGARREVDELTRKIGELRQFEHNYRGRLDVYIASQLEALRADGFIEAQQPS
jgi:DivIVA domain-containing protein